jgi:uncharacterized protein (DUF2267 family)
MPEASQQAGVRDQRSEMPFPMEYRIASQTFDQFLADVAEETGLTTRNQAYTTAQAVFVCFRRRLSLREATAFAQILPALVRALFVQDWNTEEPRVETWERDMMTAEVRQLRMNHNFSPDTAIGDVARVTRKYVDPAELDHCLATLPPAARAFWS